MIRVACTRAALALTAVVLVTAACSSDRRPAASSSTTTSTRSGSTTASTSTTTSTSTTSGAGGGDAGAPSSLNVLFIGNSYTYVNDLPSWVHKLADAAGVMSVAVDSVTVGGATLADQVSSTGAVDRIRQGGWTHVVIQGQSVEPLLGPASFEGAAAVLASEAKKVGAIPLFYETWARKAGDAVYQQGWSGGTPAAMQAGLRSEYLKVAVAGVGAVAPAGDAWERALAEQPGIGLFQADGSHPTSAGTYLTASVFYGRIVGHSPVGIALHPSDVSATDAAALQTVAEEVVGAPP
jgi:predicted regulator of Ras-like GTPase activity (Roadblock/LC7/MglB family)